MPISPRDGKDSQNPSIACSLQNVHVVWADYRTGTYEVFYKMSADSGITWQDGNGTVGQDRRLTFMSSTLQMAGPDGIAVSGSHVHVLYTWITSDNVRHAMYLHSPDNGVTWNPEIELSSDPLSAYAYGLVAEGSTVHVVWTGLKDGNNEIYYRNSIDNGTTWEPEVRLTFDPVWSDKANIAVNGSHVFVVWQDDRDHYNYIGNPSGAYELYFKESFDGGTTWGNDTRLTYAVNDSCQPRVAMDANYIHVTWTDNRTNGSKDQIFYKRYPDFPDTDPPAHSNECPGINGYAYNTTPIISVHVTDSSGVNASTIQLYVNGSTVLYNLTSIPGGYNVSYFYAAGFALGVVTCRIVANDTLDNRLDFTWNFTVLYSFNIPLVAGWNLISLPLVQTDTSISSVLTSIAGIWDRIMLYDPVDTTNPWKQYYTNWSSSLNEMSQLNHSLGFWLNVTAPATFTVYGLLPNSTNISLHMGWNLIGYPARDDSTYTDGQLKAATGATIVENFDAAATYMTKVLADNYVMKRGEAYWVYVPADTMWIVDW